ncbi:M20 aminoacylase family protein [Marinibaculum pumilum]|uniref:M20 aminoacylase family protein n=1 Tax=Marinibaculum pumilum TaxID=1766165 RepID=A0ABV7KXG8_9PROT
MENDPVYKRISSWREELQAIRRDIHAHPETAFEEKRTSELVAAKLESFGIEVHRGLGRTGVVGTLRSGGGNRAIGLRADMDALDLQEKNKFDHRSTIDGKMHACGHDGHTTMLLGAAKHLAEKPDFDGIVHFIFQPAEENEGGARVMIEDGLFEKFPVESVFGMHNMPGHPVGHFCVKPGPMMAGFDMLEIRVTGNGGHAAIPHHTVDPIVVASHIVTALQAIVSRNVDPIKSAVLSITQIHAGANYNVIPNEVFIAGCARYFDPAVQDMIEANIRRTAESVAAAFGATVEVTYERRYPSTINSEAEAQLCADVLTRVAGAERVNTNPAPLMGSEDFAFMLQAKPGCYIWAGNGAGEGSCMVHNPGYDFNDDVIAYGATYWVHLAQTALPLSEASREAAE